jgi:hypothetical protein
MVMLPLHRVDAGGVGCGSLMQHDSMLRNRSTSWIVRSNP